MGTSKILIDGVGIDLTADTVAANKMLSGIMAHDSNGDSVTGNIESKAAETFTPTTADQTIAAGKYLSGAQTVKGDANLVAGNIKQGVSIFGVAGNLTPGITPSGTKNITANGTYDVTQYASAAVNVPVGAVNCKRYSVNLANAHGSEWVAMIGSDTDLAAHRSDDSLMVMWRLKDITTSLESALLHGFAMNYWFPLSTAINKYRRWTVRLNGSGDSGSSQGAYNMYSEKPSLAQSNAGSIYIDSNGTLEIQSNASYSLKAGSYEIIVAW